MIIAGFAAAAVPAQARELTALFIGNSYTYYPGETNDPGLPRFVQRIAESIEPGLRLRYVFNTQGGYNLAMHYNDPVSRRLLQGSYDAVVLQGRSIESLPMTPWMERHGYPGASSFAVHLPLLLELAFRGNRNVGLYVNWGWHPNHAYLQEEHPGLRFPPGTAREGQRWCGTDAWDYQRLINEGYAEHAQGFDVTFARVGDAWLALQAEGLVTSEELYRPADWSHPSVLGSYVAALVIVRDVLRMDISRNRYVPAGLDDFRCGSIGAFLALR